MIPERLKQAKSFGCETIDLTKGDPLATRSTQILGVPEVDCAVDCVGFEARGHGKDADEEPPRPCSTRSWTSPAPAARWASPASTSPATRAASTERQERHARHPHRPGLGQDPQLTTGQCPVMQYNRELMEGILHDKIQIAKAVNATVISLDDAPKGYKDFDKGAAKKFVIDPHGMIEGLSGPPGGCAAAISRRSSATRSTTRSSRGSRPPSVREWPIA